MGRAVASRTGRYLSLFVMFFALLFLWLHLVGPRTTSYYITHEPLSAVASTVWAFLVSLVITIYLAKRVG